MKYHPDHNPGDKAAEEEIKKINEAYSILSDPAQRQQYDQQLAQQKAQQTAGAQSAQSYYQQKYKQSQQQAGQQQQSQQSSSRSRRSYRSRHSYQGYRPRQPPPQPAPVSLSYPRIVLVIALLPLLCILSSGNFGLAAVYVFLNGSILCFCISQNTPNPSIQKTFRMASFLAFSIAVLAVRLLGGD